MSTRSVNIIKENGKLLFFWMHWDGASAADTILNWSDAERKYAFNKIRQPRMIVSNIYGTDNLKRYIKHAAEELLNETIAINDDGTRDCEWRVVDRLERLKELDYVNSYPMDATDTELAVFECEADKFGPVDKVQTIYQRIKELTGKFFISDFQIVNYIDLDGGECRFDYWYSNWSKAKQKYIDHHVTLEKSFPLEKVKKNGAEYTMGVRYYNH